MELHGKQVILTRIEFFENSIFIPLLLSFIEGPDLPKTLESHSSLAHENELIVLGGESEEGYSTSVYKMSCSNGTFSNWTEMEVHLKTPRMDFVASFIPNDLINKNDII